MRHNRVTVLQGPLRLPSLPPSPQVRLLASLCKSRRPPNSATHRPQGVLAPLPGTPCRSFHMDSPERAMCLQQGLAQSCIFPGTCGCVRL